MERMTIMLIRLIIFVGNFLIITSIMGKIGDLLYPYHVAVNFILIGLMIIIPFIAMEWMVYYLRKTVKRY
ncbi:hypothetical protein [Priestia taiwanensis]|uniref:Uncharacterized protein n=1 Tax=Priestia taiwanensis TaxID=1347902 RepID=A0A917EMC8_9BACI|nr:hypothetical protein [Priestia taiwanensis]MBM7362202.1 divalent metal cation (Fe/Co/Zn/Cd) transporter [Priestia taiwanensis]GGE60197.1 hypothetical protein GCM10007140_08240 [Priestia taiwanensis]